MKAAPCPPGYAFIHIPKNAGTAVIRAIADNALPIRVVGHAYPERRGCEEIVVLRDPAARFVSAFHYERRYWPNQVNVHFADANALAESAADPGHPKHALACIALGNRNEDYLARSGKPQEPHRVAGRVLARTWIYEPQSSWLIHAPAHVLRYRHLVADVAALAERLGCVLRVPLQRLNSSEGPGLQLSSAARSFVEALYADDYAAIRARGLDV